VPHEETVGAAPPRPHDLPRDEPRVEALVSGASPERLQIGPDDRPFTKALAQPRHAALDEVAGAIGAVRVPGPHRVDVEHRRVDLDVVDPSLEVLPQAARVPVAVGRQAEDVDAERDVDRPIDALEQLEEELRPRRAVFRRVARVLDAVVDGEAHVVELDLVEAELLGLLGELDDHRVVVAVVGVEPGPTGSPAHPRLVATDMQDGPLGMPRRKLRISEAGHPRDGVHAGLLQTGHESPGVPEEASLLRVEDRHPRVVGHAPGAVLEIDDDGIGPRTLDEVEHVGEAVAAKVVARQIDAGRPLPLRRHGIVEIGAVRRCATERSAPGGGRGIGARVRRRKGHPRDRHTQTPHPTHAPHRRSPPRRPGPPLAGARSAAHDSMRHRRAAVSFSSAGAPRPRARDRRDRDGQQRR